MDTLKPSTLRRLWGLIQEPRSVTLAMAAGYSLAATLGGWWLVTSGGGPSLRDWAALLLVVGGVLGVVGALPGEWALERIGIFAMISGWAVHLTITLTDPGLSDHWDETAILVLIGCLAVRLIRTWGVPRSPSRGLAR